jgi:hypothetical protein
MTLLERFRLQFHDPLSRPPFRNVYSNGCRNIQPQENFSEVTFSKILYTSKVPQINPRVEHIEFLSLRINVLYFTT